MRACSCRRFQGRLPCTNPGAPISWKVVLESAFSPCVRSEASEFPNQKAPADCAYAYAAMLVFVRLRVTSPRVLTCPAPSAICQKMAAPTRALPLSVDCPRAREYKQRQTHTRRSSRCVCGASSWCSRLEHGTHTGSPERPRVGARARLPTGRIARFLFIFWANIS